MPAVRWWASLLLMRFRIVYACISAMIILGNRVGYYMYASVDKLAEGGIAWCNRGLLQYGIIVYIQGGTLAGMFGQCVFCVKKHKESLFSLRRRDEGKKNVIKEKSCDVPVFIRRSFLSLRLIARQKLSRKHKSGTTVARAIDRSRRFPYIPLLAGSPERFCLSFRERARF